MSKRILLVDDDKQFLHAMSLRIQRLGLEFHQGLQVDTAQSDLAAISAVAEWTPDLICIDVHMPCGNGLDIGEFFAHERATSSVPIVVLTGRKDRRTMSRVGELKAYYVHKSPQVWTGLRAAICRLLDGPTQRLPAGHRA